MVDCLLINSPDQFLSNHLIADPKAPLGLLHIAAHMREKGVTVEILDCHSRQYKNIEEITEEVVKLNPLLVGLNITTPNRHIVFEIIFQIKAKLPKCTVVAGGPHATCLPEDVFANSPLDGIVVGEGEITLLNVIQNLPHIDCFHGFYSRSSTRNDTKVIESPRILNLDDLPIPAYDLIDIKKYLSVNPELYISSGRGCSHSCAFCSVRVQYGSKVIFRSCASTIHEIQELKKTYNVERFYFYNENVSIWPELEEFCQNIKSVKVRWSAQANINDLDADLIPLLASSGCYALGMGFESGSHRMQKYIGKIINNDALSKLLKLNKAGIYPRGFFVIGFPDEDKLSILETARFLIACKLAGLKDIVIFPARPYPGTKLYQELVSLHGENSKDEILNYQYLEDYKETGNSLIRLKLHRYNTISSFKVCNNFNNIEIRQLVKSLYAVFYHAKRFSEESDDIIWSYLFSSNVS